MLVGFLADLHLPRYYSQFIESLKNTEKNLDLLFILGDLTDGRFIYIKKLYEIIKRHFEDIKIYSIFGNNEYYEYRDFLKKEFPWMNWIDDEKIEIGKYEVIGTEGVLDDLTPWMKKNMPWIKDIWEQRLKKIEELLKNSKKDVILLSHYAPVCKTIEGDPAPKKYLCSRRFESLILKYKPKFVFHAHAHFAKIWKWKMDSTEIYNVSFPVHKKIFVIEL